MTSRHAITVVIAIVLTGGILSGSATATPPGGEVVRNVLAKGIIDTPISIVTDGQRTAVYIQKLLLKPGASSGWHSHPGPEVSVLTKGTVHQQRADVCEVNVFVAGQAVFIPAGIPHLVVNHGPDEAEAVVAYTLPADSAVSDDAPAVCP